MINDILEQLGTIAIGVTMSLTLTACGRLTQPEATPTPGSPVSVDKNEVHKISQNNGEALTKTSPPSSPQPFPTSRETPTASTSTHISPQIITDTYGISMVRVPSAPFKMGEDPNQALSHCKTIYGEESCYDNWFDDEGPIHIVTLDEYYIDQYEVTYSSYVQCVDAGRCDLPSDTYYYDRLQQYGSYPITRISWYQAEAYCAWREARLPTEAEWEKAARGIEGQIYPWGNEAPTDTRFSNGGSPKYTQLTAVGSFPDGVSPYGAYDMVGNVWEWVADWYDAEYYSNSPSINPTGPSSGEEKVVRGGAWQPDGVNARAASREKSNPSDTFNMLGFRCARSSGS